MSVKQVQRLEALLLPHLPLPQQHLLRGLIMEHELACQERCQFMVMLAFTVIMWIIREVAF